MALHGDTFSARGHSREGALLLPLALLGNIPLVWSACAYVVAVPFFSFIGATVASSRSTTFSVLRDPTPLDPQESSLQSFWLPPRHTPFNALRRRENITSHAICRNDDTPAPGGACLAQRSCAPLLQGYAAYPILASEADANEGLLSDANTTPSPRCRDLGSSSLGPGRKSLNVLLFLLFPSSMAQASRFSSLFWLRGVDKQKRRTWHNSPGGFWFPVTNI